MTSEERKKLLLADDETLLRQCRIETFRGSGRGGQKRNRTDSAVRVTHVPTAISASSDATRSQHTNRRLALRRLRQAVALTCRCRPPATSAGPWRPGPKSPAYLSWLAWVLDVLDMCEYRLADAGAHFPVGTGRLVRDLAADTALWQHVNARRRDFGHGPLRPPKP